MLDADEEDLAARQDAMIEAEEAHANQRSVFMALESKILGREGKAMQKERDLVLRERALADTDACESTFLSCSHFASTANVEEEYEIGPCFAQE
jgi:hypothetical protein